MATKAQMTALLAVRCTWCGAQPGTRCQVRVRGRQNYVPSTLDGESHDARWQAALGMSAPVLTASVHDMLGLAASAERPW